jgi:hypothetical protein
MIAILALAAQPFVLCQRAPDFINPHVHFADLADSLLHSRSYPVNSREGLVRPVLPGLPVHPWHSMLLIHRSERSTL